MLVFLQYFDHQELPHLCSTENQANNKSHKKANCRQINTKQLKGYQDHNQYDTRPGPEQMNRSIYN